MHSFSKLDILEVDAPAKRFDQKKVSSVFHKDINLKETNVDGCSKAEIRFVIPAKCKKNMISMKRSCSLNNEDQEILATVLLINPNARQNISLVRHGSLPPLRL